MFNHTNTMPDYSPLTGKALSEAEKDIIYDAEEDMKRLVDIKRAFFEIMVDVLKQTKLSKEEYMDGFIVMEQTLDDMLHDAWYKAKEAACSYESLPESAIYTAWLNRNKAKTTGEQYLDILNKDTAISVKGEL